MRIFRLIATPIVLLGLLGLLVWGATWGWKALTEPLPSPSPTPCVVGPAEMIIPADISVRVFNGGFTSGLANRVGGHLERAGFNVVKVGNTEERIVGTVIRANERESVQAAVTAAQFIEPVVEYDDRVDGTVDVLVGTDFKGSTPSPSITAAPPPPRHACPGPAPSPAVPASPSPTPPAPSPTP